MKQLILNADDYGMNEATSRGILHVASKGAVRSTSAMSSSTDFERAMWDLDSSGVDLDVGIHLNLTWGRPLSDPARIPSLVDDDGRFHGRSKLLAKALAGTISGSEVYRELRLQCERISERLSAITHLDGHHHVHVYPIVREVAERLARQFRIPYVRAPLEGLWSPWHWESARRLGMSMLAASSPGYWRRRGFRTADYFGGFALGGGDGLERKWFRTLCVCPDGVGEIMVHPGRPSADNDSYNVGREAELRWFASEGFLKSAGDLGIEFTSFREISST